MLSYFVCLFLLPLVWSFGVLPRTTEGGIYSTRCKVMAGDAAWPDGRSWNSLNATVNGRLLATAPLARVCHDPVSYSATACQALKDVWTAPQTHLGIPGDFNAPYFQVFRNQSCLPFTDMGTPCRLGNEATYSINVTGASDVIAALAFARKNQVRLSIKNTGNDFLGKSSGRGGLELWTNNLKSASVVRNYQSQKYCGPAIKLGAGMLASEAYAFAHSHGYRVVGGACATVGLAGGYTQGGGHSPLMHHYGMGADNVLEWEVVTPSGQHVVAAPQGKYADLYWALSGGGGGTWGVVLSMTTKAHADGPVGGASLTVPAAGLDPDTFWDLVAEFTTASLPANDAGTGIASLVSNQSLVLIGATAPNKTADEVRKQLAPFTTSLEARGIPHSTNYTYFDNYYQHMEHYFGPYPYGGYNISQLTGGRLVPRAVVESPDATRRLTTALRTIASGNAFVFNFNSFSLAATSSAAAYAQNAILPAWRQSAVQLIVIAPWDWTQPYEDLLALQDRLTNEYMPLMAASLPADGQGAYLNEANFQEPEWQTLFYGDNYARLSAIKKKYDPEGLLYARTGVGSQDWKEDGYGRLCRV